eukprot:tig00000881_g5239.t1
MSAPGEGEAPAAQQRQPSFSSRQALATTNPGHTRAVAVFVFLRVGVVLFGRAPTADGLLIVWSGSGILVGFSPSPRGILKRESELCEAPVSKGAASRAGEQ